MSAPYTDDQVAEALKGCASEPVRIPGTIQPFGYLLACEPESGIIRYASINASALFGCAPADIFGQSLRDVLGADPWHAVQNFRALGESGETRYFAGLWDHDGQAHAIHLSGGDPFVVVEIEDAGAMPVFTPERLREQTFLVEQLRTAADEPGLHDLTTRLLRHVTGFDRVMIYRFDADWNGEVLAEARAGTLDPFMGLRFPHWDIPEQARAIMAELPLRLIGDVRAEPVSILAESDTLPPLDIAHAQLRGVSPVHMQYLRNMGSNATMTLSVMVDGRLWGIISFHHSRPKVASSETRELLVNSVLPVFSLKLGMLQNKAALAVSQKLDAVQADIQREMDEESSGTRLLDRVGPVICDALSVCGLALRAGTQTFSYGENPGTTAIDALIAEAEASERKPWTSSNLASEHPQLLQKLRGIAGALVIGAPKGRSLLLFRKDATQTVRWAGNPSKTIEAVDGDTRLRPRGSFSTYLEEVKGRAPVWSQNDQRLAAQLWPLLSAAERKSMADDLSRQQDLMIGELNHRVRNILALVKSVSQQARREGSSLESYSQALESRIHALAAAHDLGAGAAANHVSMYRVIDLERQPYQREDVDRVRISGADFSLRADVAPIFALVIHELMTNAVKYGALSVPDGQIGITLSPSPNGMVLEWEETGGPPLEPERTSGFGTSLIRQAVPHELYGETHMEFATDGLWVRLRLPHAVLVEAAETVPLTLDSISSAKPLDRTNRSNGVVLILEDNYLIARNMAAELDAVGYPNCEVFSRPEDALEFLQHGEAPVFALLDVHLGHGLTSEGIAQQLLQQDVPFAFVTGYGDALLNVPNLQGVPVLSKPASRGDLSGLVSRLTS
ncbi:MAG: HWE histidine kinase domain-containing protein [Pseudomonadota bacterium]